VRPKLSELQIKLFADGADLATMIEMSNLDHIKGLTTNPTLMRKSGIKDYKAFSKEVLDCITQKPISFEVFSDDEEEMKRQGMEIASWAENVYVKIPITTSDGKPTTEVIRFLVKNEVKVNVTAVLTTEQVESTIKVLDSSVPSYISVFAGRIADTGRDPIEIMVKSLMLMKPNDKCELIWASPRELLNIFQADQIGCHIITATSEVLNKLKLIGKDLSEYSLETVKMFKEDAEESGFRL
jgi:transaldolase